MGNTVMQRLGCVSVVFEVYEWCALCLCAHNIVPVAVFLALSLSFFLGSLLFLFIHVYITYIIQNEEDEARLCLSAAAAASRP